MDKEKLKEAVERSFTVSDVLRYLGYDKLLSGHFKYIKNKIHEFGIDISHMKGRGWRSVDTNFDLVKYTDEELFVENGPCVVRRRRAQKFLEKNNVEYKCSSCTIIKWNGKPLTLHIDHVDGNVFNNALINLRYLCPNCHQQTETWGSKNGKKRKVSKNKYGGDRYTAFEQRKILWEAEQKKLIPTVIESKIDFSKFGWINKVAPLINQKPQKVKKWMTRVMPEFYEGCFKKNMRP